MEDWPVPNVNSSDLAAYESEFAYESAVVSADEIRGLFASLNLD